ncbi:MAG: galactokinase family protein [Pseudomonadota bacterium]
MRSRFLKKPGHRIRRQNMKQIIASAPGSIMITGEHAVVYGHPAMTCAIDQRVSVTIKPTETGYVEIISEIAPIERLSLNEPISLEGPLRFVRSAIATCQDGLSGGLRLEIASSINPNLGLGSSAAVTIAALGALSAASNAPAAAATGPSLHHKSLRIVRQLQDGRGSGADLAASLQGGLIEYQLIQHDDESRIDPDVSARFSRLPDPPPLSLRYAGYKTPTGTVLAQIAKRMEGRDQEFTQLYARMGKEASVAISAARAHDWDRVAQSMNHYQLLMAELGVSDNTLDKIVESACQDPTVMAAKISGAGLGDCVVAMGALPDGFTPMNIAQSGLVVSVE